MTGFADPELVRPTEWRSERTRTLFAQTMALLGLTSGVFAVGAFIGRNLSTGASILGFVVAFGCLIGMNFAISRSTDVTLLLLGGFGLFLGLGTAPALSHYAAADPAAVWQAAVATGLFLAGFGAAGYATKRDLATLSRFALWALVALIVFGVVVIFVQIPNGSLIYAVLALLIFAVLTAADFQRVRRGDSVKTAPLLAAAIFLDILNVFLIFLDLFSFGDSS
jgi:FtsH-binding integral membrane protein